MLLLPNSVYCAVAYAESFHVFFFIQWHIVAIYVWCALFVTYQFDVIVVFPNYFWIYRVLYISKDILHFSHIILQNISVTERNETERLD